MPIHDCQEDGKPGYQWGKSGKCYTYTKGNEEEKKTAKAKAEKQAKAIYASGYRENTEMMEDIQQQATNKLGDLLNDD